MTTEEQRGCSCRDRRYEWESRVWRICSLRRTTASRRLKVL